MMAKIDILDAFAGLIVDIMFNLPHNAPSSPPSPAAAAAGTNVSPSQSNTSEGETTGSVLDTSFQDILRFPQRVGGGSSGAGLDLYWSNSAAYLSRSASGTTSPTHAIASCCDYWTSHNNSNLVSCYRSAQGTPPRPPSIPAMNASTSYSCVATTHASSFVLLNDDDFLGSSGHYTPSGAAAHHPEHTHRLRSQASGEDKETPAAQWEGSAAPLTQRRQTVSAAKLSSSASSSSEFVILSRSE